MKKALAIVALGGAISIAGCTQLMKIGQDICQGEETAHAYYVSFIAPFRPADRVALELKRYTTVHNLCAVGASQTQITKAAAQSDAVRQ